MGLAILDSSTVVAYLDADDLLHGEAAAAIETTMRGGTGIAISAVTWAELLHGAVLGHRNENAVREFAVDFGIDILAVDEVVAERAAQLQADYAHHGRSGTARRLKTPDALILATADLEDLVGLIVCGDEKWRRVRNVSADVKLIRERRRRGRPAS